MALLLRMGGVPARRGHRLLARRLFERKQAWIVRDTDAHSWVEAWFDDYGWVTFDPTPPATPARSQIAAIAAPPSAAALRDAAITNQGGRGQRLGRPRAAGSREELFNRLRGAGGATAERGRGARGSGGGPPLWLLVPFALLLSAGAGVAIVRTRRRRPDDPLDRAIIELEAALRRSGPEPAGGMTLRQLERKLALSQEAAGYLRAISAGRYAPRPVLPTNAQRRALRRELATRARLREPRADVLGAAPAPALTGGEAPYSEAAVRGARGSWRISDRMRSSRGSALVSTCVIAAATAGGARRSARASRGRRRDSRDGPRGPSAARSGASPRAR